MAIEQRRTLGSWQLLAFSALLFAVGFVSTTGFEMTDISQFDEMMDQLRHAEGWSNGETDRRSDESKLIQQLNTLPPEELAATLKAAGYHDINLGEHATHEVQVHRAVDSASFCETKAQYHTSITHDPDVFIEEDSSVELRSKTGEPVACACDEFDCTCRKQCFCKVQAEPFSGKPTPECQKCTNCDGTPVEDGSGSGSGSDSNMPDRPFPAAHEFKCSCSFDGAGGGEEPNKNAMDCDCKESDCKCTRKCKCRTMSSL
jgi:hypothetical protein